MSGLSANQINTPGEKPAQNNPNRFNPTRNDGKTEGYLPGDFRARALTIWREREATFPRFTQRMTPDKMGMETGAWAHVVMQALGSVR